jgi:hypothetical protein
MSTTWSAIDDMIQRMLDDPDGEEFTEQARIDSWNWAQRHFVHHTPRQQIQTGLKMESDGRAVVLPSDFYEIGRLYDPVEKQWWQQQQWQPGGAYDTTWESFTFTVWGGVLYLYDDVSSDNSYELWYYAYWPDVEFRIESSVVVVTEDKVLVPRWAESALVHLAAAFCLNPQAVQAAKTRQWNIKIDSGRPTDNSRAVQTRELLWWYNALIGAYPPLDRGGH